MRILVTGGAGFIGSHTVDALLQQGHQVRVLDALEPPVHPTRERPAYLPKDADVIVGDVRSRDDWEKALKGVDAVFHLAAYQDYLLDFSQFAHVNDVGTALLYEVIVAKRLALKRVVVASSQAVYGEGKCACPEHGVQYPGPRSLVQLQEGEWELECAQCGCAMKPVWTNESVVRPHNQYAVSKYAQELYALTLGRLHTIPTVALRYSIVHGPRQSPYNAYSGVLRIFATRLLRGERPIVYEDGKQLRDYVAVQDVVRANLLVLEHTEAVGKVFNVGGDRAVTVLEYAHLLIQLLDKDIEPEVPGLFRLGDMRHILSDVSSLKGLGWRPQIPLEQVARDYIEWVTRQPVVTKKTDDAMQKMRQMGVLREVK